MQPARCIHPQHARITHAKASVRVRFHVAFPYDHIMSCSCTSRRRVICRALCICAQRRRTHKESPACSPPI
eukprot:5268259-Prymnesium_polylepis.2